MYGVVRDVNANIFGGGLELRRANEWSCLLSHLLFAKGAALSADLEDTRFWFEAEFGTVFEQIKLRGNLSFSWIMRFSGSDGANRIKAFQNGEFLKAVEL